MIDIFSNVIMKKVIIIGGGLAGLISAVMLSKKSGFEVLLVDKNDTFLNLIRLHLTFKEPIENFQKKFLELSKKFHFRFLQKEVNITPENLVKWEKDSRIEELNESFDYLVLSTGAKQRSLDSGITVSSDSRILGLNDFITQKWKDSAYDILSASDISFVGGGASSIQFLFELFTFLDKYKSKPKINFFTMEERLLSNLPKIFHDYTLSKFKNKNTKFFSKQKIESTTRDEIRVYSLIDSKTKDYPSDITFLFLGVTPSPFKILTNEYGQVKQDDTIFKNIFAAGDCSTFISNGDNSMSAQIAVRKARIITRNIFNLVDKQKLLEFNYKELGYFISMGDLDGIGWMLNPNNVLFGPGAFAVKELIEKQFELFVTGVDTYIDF